MSKNVNRAALVVCHGLKGARYSTTATFPFSAAHISGVQPRLSFFARSAPAVTISSTASRLTTASCNVAKVTFLGAIGMMGIATGTGALCPEMEGFWTVGATRGATFVFACWVFGASGFFPSAGMISTGSSGNGKSAETTVTKAC